MKKIIWTIILLLILFLVIILVKISDNNNKMSNINSFNVQFEEYNGKTLYGADVCTIINKAIDNNNFFNIEKDEKGFYINDNKYCLKIELTLLSKNEEGNIDKIKYGMEILQKAGLDGFISNFSLVSFKCTDIKYNSIR